MRTETRVSPTSGVAPARGLTPTCEYEASCANAVETPLGIHGLVVHREHDRIVGGLAWTVDGVDHARCRTRFGSPQTTSGGTSMRGR
jgi:hypothetical protein